MVVLRQVLFQHDGDKYFLELNIFKNDDIEIIDVIRWKKDGLGVNFTNFIDWTNQDLHDIIEQMKKEKIQEVAF